MASRRKGKRVLGRFDRMPATDLLPGFTMRVREVRTVDGVLTSETSLLPGSV